MKFAKAWMPAILTISAILIVAPFAQAQSFPQSPAYGQPQGPMPGGMPYAPIQQAGYGPQGMQYAPPMNPSMAVGYAMQGPQVPVGQPFCGNCGGQGCESCSGQLGGGQYGGPMGLTMADVRNNFLDAVLPYSEGGRCAPRWFDVSAELLYLTRENVSRLKEFTSVGIGGAIVLDSNDLDFDEEGGIKVTVAAQVGPGSDLEFTYMGGFNWSVDSEVTGAGNLYSAFSAFGTVPGGGFVETDAADRHSIAYSSSIDGVELNYRRRWAGTNCRIQGSWLMGVRYFQLDEEFRHVTESAGGFVNYFNGTTNAMTGFQVGGDIWLTLVPGVRIGAEIKAGVYGNTAEQKTLFAATSIAPALVEITGNDNVALVSEAKLIATYRINHSWTFTAGYHFMYVDGVALAIENFDSTAPFLGGVRTPSINDNGNAFYHGFTGGFEWMW